MRASWNNGGGEWRGNGEGMEGGPRPNPDTLEAQALWSGPSSALPEVYPASHIVHSYWPSAGRPSSCDDATPVTAPVLF